MASLTGAGTSERWHSNNEAEGYRYSGALLLDTRLERVPVLELVPVQAQHKHQAKPLARISPLIT